MGGPCKGRYDGYHRPRPSDGYKGVFGMGSGVLPSGTRRRRAIGPALNHHTSFHCQLTLKISRTNKLVFDVWAL